LKILQLLPFLFSVYLNASELPITIFNGIYQFNGDDYIGLRLTYLVDSTEYGVFNIGNGNHWSYKKNDLLYLDSSTIKIIEINHDSNSAVIAEVSYTPQKSDTLFMGIWRENGPYAVLEKSSMKLIANTASTATFRYYNLGYRKIFSFDNDTCIIEGRKLTYLHINDESLPIVNCRNITIRDTLITLNQYYFRARPPCISDRIHIDGEINGCILEITIELDDYHITKYMFLQGDVDSSDITLSLNDSYIDQKNGTSVTLSWSTLSDLDNFAGFKIYQSPSLTNGMFGPKLNSGIKQHSTGTKIKINVLGQEMSGNRSYRSNVILKKSDSKEIVIW
jgi:hypothetical protein